MGEIIPLLPLHIYLNDLEQQQIYFSLFTFEHEARIPPTQPRRAVYTPLGVSFSDGLIIHSWLFIALSARLQRRCSKLLYWSHPVRNSAVLPATQTYLIRFVNQPLHLK